MNDEQKAFLNEKCENIIDPEDGVTATGDNLFENKIEDTIFIHNITRNRMYCMEACGAYNWLSTSLNEEQHIFHIVRDTIRLDKYISFNDYWVNAAIVFNLLFKYKYTDIGLIEIGNIRLENENRNAYYAFPIPRNTLIPDEKGNEEKLSQTPENTPNPKFEIEYSGMRYTAPVDNIELTRVSQSYMDLIGDRLAYIKIDDLILLFEDNENYKHNIYISEKILLLLLNQRYNKFTLVYERTILIGNVPGETGMVLGNLYTLVPITNSNSTLDITTYNKLPENYLERCGIQNLEADMELPDSYLNEYSILNKYVYLSLKKLVYSYMYRPSLNQEQLDHLITMYKSPWILLIHLYEFLENDDVLAETRDQFIINMDSITANLPEIIQSTRNMRPLFLALLNQYLESTFYLRPNSITKQELKREKNKFENLIKNFTVDENDSDEKKSEEFSMLHDHLYIILKLISFADSPVIYDRDTQHDYSHFLKVTGTEKIAQVNNLNDRLSLAAAFWIPTENQYIDFLTQFEQVSFNAMINETEGDEKQALTALENIRTSRIDNYREVRAFLNSIQGTEREEYWNDLIEQLQLFYP